MAVNALCMWKSHGSCASCIQPQNYPLISQVTNLNVLSRGAVLLHFVAVCVASTDTKSIVVFSAQLCVVERAVPLLLGNP